MKIKNGILYCVYDEDLRTDGSFVVPNNVTRIRQYAFERCYSLTSITIPNSVTSIGECAFHYCTGLTSITIPDSVTDIEACAFLNCVSLESIIIGNGVTSIGSWAFLGCSALTSLTIGNGVTRIGSSAFYGCSHLTSKRANYKAFNLTENGELKCLSKIYTVGKKSIVRGELELCENGIHYCTNLYDIFRYYCGRYGKDFVIGVCDVSDENASEENDSKRCARWIIPTKILSREEVIGIINGEDEGIVV